ncbi:hypothetical protein [Pontibacterium sp.]
MGIGLGSISDMSVTLDAFSKLLSGVGGVATAAAAFIALGVYRHQRLQDQRKYEESRSQFYLNECLSSVRNAMTILREEGRSHESFISAGLILGEVTQLERNIVNPDHRRLYTLHRQYEIDRAEHVFAEISDQQLRGEVFGDAAFDFIVLGNIHQSNGSEQLYDTHFYTENLLDGRELITPFPGVPIGRLLCILRFCVNDPHYTAPSDRITDRELNELHNLKPIQGVARYINQCLQFDVKDNEIILREDSIELQQLNLNYDMMILRNFVH